MVNALEKTFPTTSESIALPRSRSKKRFITFRVSWISCFFLAVIICMNPIRHIFGLSSSIISYGCYFLFVSSSVADLIINRKKNIGFKGRGSSFYYLFVGFVIYTFIAPFFNISTLFVAFKMLIYLLILCSARLLNHKDIHLLFKLIVLINIIYSILLITGARSIQDFDLESDMNYLNLSLTIGLSLTILLTKLFLMFALNKIKVFSFVVELIMALILFLGANSFAARSTYLFPVLTVALIVFSLVFFNFKLFVKLAIPLTIVVIVGIIIFINHSSDYAFSRMMALFNNLSSEDRIYIWGKCLEIIGDEKLFLFGGGINKFEAEIGFYPHNFIIQFVGEIGLIGVLICVYIIGFFFYAFVHIFSLLRKPTRRRVNATIFPIIVFSSFLFILLNFLKSFTIYEGLLLYLFLVFSIKEVGVCLKKGKIKNAKVKHRYSN